MPKLRFRLVFTTSVVVMETTAGATRAATSANDGIVTEVTGPAAVCTGVVVWALDCRINPRSAVRITPKATEAMMIAIVDRMRLVDEFMTSLAPLTSMETIKGSTARCVAPQRQTQDAIETFRGSVTEEKKRGGPKSPGGGGGAHAGRPYRWV